MLYYKQTITTSLQRKKKIEHSNRQEAKKEEPNKSFIAELVKRATQASNDATNAIDAGSGLWNKAKPIVEKLLPYLGVGLTFFA